jgi:O-succinylhomoserine sulfhydrylase
MLKGLEILPLRLNQAQTSALNIARFLEEHPKVSKVHYPGLESHAQHELAKSQMSGFGTMMAFEIAGDKYAAFRLENALEIISISNNLGDTKSLITHPATTTHQRLEDDEKAELSITPSLLRFSVGLEDEKDLINDLDIALGAV